MLVKLIISSEIEIQVKIVLKELDNLKSENK